jgi:pimeloyl-ACP methyl ester carboxylesterase
MLKDLHIRAIVPDRPGYGLSAFQRHRRLLDWPADVEQLADHLGLERFAVLGVSGGGPHAAACAYAIPHRLSRVGLVSSAAPLELAPLRARLPIERLAIFTARYLPWPVLRVASLLTLRSARANPSRWAHISSIRVSARAGQSFKSLLAQVSSSGPIVQAPPVVCEMVLEPFRQGVRGFAWDVRTCAHPWGFHPDAIHGVEVYLWHGEQDAVVSIAAARALATAIPDCQATFYPNETHDITAHMREMLTTLVAREEVAVTAQASDSQQV